MRKLRNQKSAFFWAVILLSVIIFAGCRAQTEPESIDQSLTEDKTEDKLTANVEQIYAKDFKPRGVKDISEIQKMRSWLEYFYYNNLFDQDTNNDSGEISKEAMMSFAASYIMQLEHKGLRFDTDTFRLYIPQKNLEEVVMRFFNVKLDQHFSLSKHGILLEDENYIIEAMPREWPTRLDIIQVTETSPKGYVAILNGNNTEIGEIEHQIQADFQVIEGRFVLKKYKVITDKAQFIEGNPLDVGNPGEDSNINEGNDNITNPDNLGEEPSSFQEPKPEAN